MSLEGAPVTRALIVVIAASSVTAAVSSRQYLFQVPLTPHLTRDHQVWRLLTHHVAFTNSSQLLLGLFVLFYSSVAVERRFGSHKFLSFVLFVALGLSTLIELLILAVGLKTGLSALPAGPFALIVALTYQCVSIVPSTFVWRVFGLTLPSDVTLYLLLFHFVFSELPGSFLSSLAGLTASWLYRSDILGPSLRVYRLPKSTSRALLCFLRLESQDGASSTADTPHTHLTAVVPPSTTAPRSSAALYADAFDLSRFVRPSMFYPALSGMVAPSALVPRPSPPQPNLSTRPRNPPTTSQAEVGREPRLIPPRPDQALELEAIVPNATQNQIAEALHDADGNVHVAVELLLRTVGR